MTNDLKGTSILNICLILFVIILITWFIQFKWNRRRLYELMSKIQTPPGLPIFGHIFTLLFSSTPFFDVLTEFFFKYGPNFGIWLNTIPLIIIGKPEDLEILMTSQNCLSKSYFYNFTKIAVGDGLFTAPVKKWKKNRKIIQPTFNSKILNSFIPIFNSTSKICVDEILPKCLGKKDIDWYKIFTSTNLDTISQTAMGVNTNAQREDLPFGLHLDRGMHAVFQRMLNVFLHPNFIFKLTKLSKNLDIAVAFAKDITSRVLKEKKEELLKELETRTEEVIDDGPIKRKAFLELLLELRHNGHHFTDQDMVDEVMTFFVGGTDTSAVTTCFFLSMMGMHQDIQQEVYEEVMSVLGEDGTPTMEDLSNLNLLERCVKETMRLFPPAPMISRTVNHKEIELTDITIPADSWLVFPIFYVHRCPDYWENVLKFNPDRFLPEEAAKRNPFTFIPFSGGLRGCVGMRYSYLNLKNLLSMIIRKYKIHCDYNNIEEIALTNQIVLRPIDGFKVYLEERK